METKKVMELRPGDYGFSVVVKVRLTRWHMYLAGFDIPRETGLSLPV